MSVGRSRRRRCSGWRSPRRASIRAGSITRSGCPDGTCRLLRSERLLIRLLRGDKILEDGAAHQGGGQQALGQDEVVKLLLVEFRAERLLGALAQLQ